MGAVTEWTSSTGVGADKLNEPFWIKAAVYDAPGTRLDITVGPGRADWSTPAATMRTTQAADTHVYIASPAISTTYYLFLVPANGSTATYRASTSATVQPGDILLGSCLTGNPIGSAVTRADLRGQLWAPTVGVSTATPQALAASGGAGNTGYWSDGAHVHAWTGLGVLANPNTWAAAQTFNAAISGTTAAFSGRVSAAGLDLTGSITGVTTLAMSGALSGATTGSFSGRVSAAGLDLTGSVTGVTTLAMSGALSGATTGTFSGGLSSAGLTASGDITTYRSFAVTTGVIYLGNTGTRFLYYDGSQYSLNGAGLAIGGGLTGVTTLAMSGGLSGVTTLAMGGTLTGVTSLSMSGALTGATTGSFSGLLSTADITTTGQVKIPASTGGTVAPTSYGSVPVKIGEVMLASTAVTVSFGGIPSVYRHLDFDWYVRSNNATTSVQLLLRMNNDSGGNYDYILLQGIQGVVVSDNETLAATQLVIADIAANTATANFFSTGEGRIVNYSGTVGNKPYIGRNYLDFGTGTSQRNLQEVMGKWRTTGSAVNQLDFIAAAGSLIVGSLITLWGRP